MIGTGEYIRRADAIEAMYKDAEANPNHTFWTSQLEAMMDIPAADVRPVRRGKWIKYAPHNSDMMTCSECEKYWILDGDQYDYHFCPNCGADMRPTSMSGANGEES